MEQKTVIKDLVSIIVPAYNTAAFLPECLESLINQTYSQLEIILIDNGSPDDKTSDVMYSYAEKDSRIRVIRKELGFAASARNAGLRIAAGEFIMFVDSDDYVAEYYVERLLSALLKYDTQIAQCCFYRVVDGKPECYLPYYETKVFSGKELCEIQASFIGLSTPMTVLWNKIYRRSVWEEVEFDETYSYEDMSLTYKLLYPVDQIVFITDHLYYLRIHSQSCTSSTYYKPDRVHEIQAYIDRTVYFRKQQDLTLVELMMKRTYYTATQHLYRMDQFKDEKETKKFLSATIKEYYPQLMRMKRWGWRTKMRMTFIYFFPKVFGWISLRKKLNFQI